MLYLFDSNAFSDLMWDPDALDTWMFQLPGGATVGICPVVRGEVLYGTERLPDGRRKWELREKAEILFGRMNCLEIPERAGDHSSRVKHLRQKQGRPMGENDLWIAATARALGATLVTRDQDFDNIDGLPVVTIR